MKLSVEDRRVPNITEHYCNNGSHTYEPDDEWVMSCGFELPHKKVGIDNCKLTQNVPES